MTSPSPHPVPAVLTGAPRLPGSVLDQLGHGGPLLSWWIPTLLAALAVLIVLIGSWRGRGRRVRVALAAPLTAVLLTLTGAASVNAYAGYVPTVSAVGPTLTAWAGGQHSSLAAAGPGTGQVKSSLSVPAVPVVKQVSGNRSSVWSASVGDSALGVPASPVWIYVPAGYASAGNTSRYPVVYALHGYPGHSSDWFTAGQLQDTADALMAAHVIPPVIVVAPDMNAGPLRDTEGLNVVHGPQIQTYLSKTVVSWADHMLRTAPDRRHRIIAGMSAGGFAALNLGLRHQNTFGGIIALEPYGTPGVGTRRTVLAGSERAYRTNSPASYLRTMRIRQPLRVYLDAGSRGDTVAVRRLAEQVRSAGATVTFAIQPDQGHTWKEAHVGIAYGLASQFPPVRAAPHASTRRAVHHASCRRPGAFSDTRPRFCTAAGSRMSPKRKVSRSVFWSDSASPTAVHAERVHGAANPRR